MKRNFLLTTDAEQDLFAIARYIEHDSPQAAGKLLEVFEHACDMLSDLPEIGSIPDDLHHSRLKGTRMWPIRKFENHLIFYRPLAGGKIEIVRVVHGARDLPALFESDVDGDETGNSPEQDPQAQRRIREI